MRLLICALLLPACGSAQNLTGTWTENYTLTSNTCGGSPPQTAQGSIQVQGQDGNYVIVAGSNTYPANQSGSKLTWGGTFTGTSNGCPSSVNTTLQIDFSNGTGSAVSTQTVTCSGQSPQTCEISYSIQAVKQ